MSISTNEDYQTIMNNKEITDFIINKTQRNKK